MIQHLTAHVTLHESSRGHYAKVGVWGVKNGKFGSIVSCHIPLAEELLEDDPESLVAVILTSLSHATYHS